MKYFNPIIPGFHPDPSICRVGEEYYLVTSSFEYFPGVPIFHSRDLINWRQIGHCLTRESQLPLAGAEQPSGSQMPVIRYQLGIWAPTIRYHNGRFYMTTTNKTQGRNFFVYSDDAAGPWSEPVWVAQAGIDPSLCFDDDGPVYFTSQMSGGIQQSVIDIETGRLIEEPRLIWGGTGGKAPEAPHLYRINGMYYLLIAEGGTEEGHMVTVARSNNPWGSFESCPRNPILTHRHYSQRQSDISCTGHGDLVQAHDGNWWMVFLAKRPNLGPDLGRETFITPIFWDDEGWPRVYENGTVYLEMEADCLPSHPWPPQPPRDDFDETELRMDWNFLFNPSPACWSLRERPGWLRLLGSAQTLDVLESSAFVGRRQQHANCRVRALLDFEPKKYREEAGIVLFVHNKQFSQIGITCGQRGRQVFVRRTLGDLSVIVGQAEIGQGPFILQIQAGPESYVFSYGHAEDALQPLATGETRYVAGDPQFTGPYLGMYATGNGQPSLTPADFDWFEYVAEGRRG